MRLQPALPKRDLESIVKDRAEVDHLALEDLPEGAPMLFSATLSGALQRLQHLALRAPFVADLASRESTVQRLSQQYVFLPANVRDVYLAYVLREVVGAEATAIVFAASCRSCCAHSFAHSRIRAATAAPSPPARASSQLASSASTRRACECASSAWPVA